MGSEPVQGIEAAIFGDVTTDQVTDWLGRHLSARLSARPAEVLFRAGRIAAVYGLRLDDGSEIAVKVHREPVDVPALAAAVRCQRALAAAGYPCPRPLDGPARTDGHVAVIETLLTGGTAADVRDPAVRSELAASLAEQSEILRSVPGVVGGLTHPPAWAVHGGGPWPTPHDPIFDFRSTPAGWEWLDDLAREAAGVIAATGADAGPVVIGHSDWNCGNVLFRGPTIVAAYDWDSLVADSAPVVAGLCAGGFTAGGTEGSQTPTPEDTVGFLADHDSFRRVRFTPAQQACAAAAATWVLAYNARCWLSATESGWADEGWARPTLGDQPGAYLRLRW